MELDDFTSCVSDILDKDIPSELLEGLNLGLIVRPELKASVQEPDRITMGVYVRSVMGKQVILYYGSFLYFYKGKSDLYWRRKMLSTIKHELTHHIEALAGQEDLAKKEIYEAELRKKKASKKDR